MTNEEIEKLIELGSELVDRAKRAGADIAEASARAGWDLSVRVRLGQPELVEEAGYRSVSLRVIKNQRVAITATSDLSESGIARAVADALMLADLSEPDPFAGPADSSDLARPPFPELDLYDPEIERVNADM